MIWVVSAHPGNNRTKRSLKFIRATFILSLVYATKNLGISILLSFLGFFFLFITALLTFVLLLIFLLPCYDLTVQHLLLDGELLICPQEFLALDIHHEFILPWSSRGLETDVDLARFLRNIGNDEGPCTQELILLRLFRKLLLGFRIQHLHQRTCVLLLLRLFLDWRLPSVNPLGADQYPPPFPVGLHGDLGRYALLLAQSQLLLGKVLSVLPFNVKAQSASVTCRNLILIRRCNVLLEELESGETSLAAVLLLHDITEPCQRLGIIGSGGSNLEHTHSLNDGAGEAVGLDSHGHTEGGFKEESSPLAEFHGGLKVGRINEALLASVD
mmetsp:Transcript_28613/g.58575  ORF Transcript_28613/g.58575 Transcript_28613/m.58575 type:complete len:328 (+) Transcript_28613:251-1234(+)